MRAPVPSTRRPGGHTAAVAFADDDVFVVVCSLIDHGPIAFLSTQTAYALSIQFADVPAPVSAALTMYWSLPELTSRCTGRPSVSVSVGIMLKNGPTAT